MALSWSTRRKMVYISILVLPALVFGGYLLWQFYQPPTCYDGVQNQDELGVDCGGSCQAVCQDLAQDASVVWSRSFNVSGPVYNSVAYIENPNVNLVAQEVPYSFKLYDAENVLITERQGVITIPPQAVFAVFEPSVETGNRVPVRTTFEFLEEPFWENTSGDRPKPQIQEKTLREQRTTPRLDITVANPSLVSIRDLHLVAILFDTDGNAVHTSRTVIDEVPAESTETTVFTWPRPFSRGVARTEVIPTRYSTDR